jgi:dihydrodipicolinate synthase/N-acetylneuraminate lyase
MTRFNGVWLPVVTPFVDGEVDYAGYERLVDHYVRLGVTGIIPLGTTGESPTIDEVERRRWSGVRWPPSRAGFRSWSGSVATIRGKS